MASWSLAMISSKCMKALRREADVFTFSLLDYIERERSLGKNEKTQQCDQIAAYENGLAARVEALGESRLVGTWEVPVECRNINIKFLYYKCIMYI